MSTIATEIETARVVHLAQTGSTNEEALSRARQGVTGPMWIRADEQTQGRGRRGRSWSSPRGNLYLSLLVDVTAKPAQLPQLAHVAAVALLQAVLTTVGSLPLLRIKWPNDVLVGTAKVAGILVEATTTLAGQQICVLGWGVNCQQHPEGLSYPVTNLSTAAGCQIEPDRIDANLKVAMGRNLALWDDGRGFPSIRALWMSRSLPVDTPLTVRVGERRVEGRYQGMDTEGRLLLMGPYGPIRVEAGDIFLSERSAALAG